MTRTRVRPSPKQLEAHPSMLPGEYRLAFEEALAAEVIGGLLKHMPAATVTVIHEMSPLLNQKLARQGFI